MKKILQATITIFTLYNLAFAQEPNYCKDKDSWSNWDALVQKYPHDMDIQMLHAVRIGFCRKIKEGTISFESARDIFNQLHESVYQKSKILQKQRKEVSKL